MFGNKRVCTNPECGRITDDSNETLCVRCGWVTRQQVITKGVGGDNKLGSGLESKRGKRAGVFDASAESEGSAPPEWGVDVDGEPDSGTPDNS